MRLSQTKNWVAMTIDGAQIVSYEVGPYLLRDFKKKGKLIILPRNIRQKKTKKTWFIPASFPCFSLCFMVFPGFSSIPLPPKCFAWSSPLRLEASLKRGLRPSGDLIPWTLTQHFLHDSGSDWDVLVGTSDRPARLLKAETGGTKILLFRKSGSYYSLICWPWLLGSCIVFPRFWHTAHNPRFWAAQWRARGAHCNSPIFAAERRM